MILVLPDKVHDIPIVHQFRGDRNLCWRCKHNAYERQDVLMPKPLPPYDFFDEELQMSYKRLFSGFKSKARSLCAASLVPLEQQR